MFISVPFVLHCLNKTKDLSVDKWMNRLYYNGVFIPSLMKEFNLSYLDIKSLNFREIFDFTEAYKYILRNNQP